MNISTKPIYESKYNLIHKLPLDLKSLLNNILVSKISYTIYDKEDDPFHSGHSELWYHRDVVLMYKYDFYKNIVEVKKHVSSGRFSDAYSVVDSFIVSDSRFQLYYYEIISNEKSIKIPVINFFELLI